MPPEDRDRGAAAGVTPPGGFTLIETIVVLVILGLVAGLVISRGPMRSPVVDVRSAATRVVEAMRAARAEAIATDHAVALTVTRATGDAPGVRVAVRVGKGRPVLLARGVSARLLFGRKTARALLFFPDGSGSGGMVRLANARARVLVTDDWLTGRITVTDAPAEESP